MFRKKIKSLLVLCAIAPSLCLAAPESSDPQATALLKEALSPPSFSYRGRMMVTHWYGPHTKTEDVRVWFKPPNSYRWEFVNPDGHVNRVHVRAGEDEYLRVAGEPTILTGKAVKSSPKQISPDREWELLQKNYDILKVNEEAVAGRQTVIVEVSPRTNEKPKQRFWIDPQTGVILAIKRFREGGRLAVYSRFTDFQQGAEVPDDKFSTRKSSPTVTQAHGYDQEFMSLAEFERESGRKSRLPEVLPLGFEFESVDTFKVDAFNVYHYRYTDGMNIVSIFETSRPSRFPASVANSPRTVRKSPGSPFQTTESDFVIERKLGKRYFTLISDVSEEALKTISQSLK